MDQLKGKNNGFKKEATLISEGNTVTRGITL